MKIGAWLLTGIAVWLWGGACWGDSGMIPFVDGVTIAKPKQRAVIAFNGREEILILSSDLRASRPTKALEVIPFPSKPTVTRVASRPILAAAASIDARLRAARPKVNDAAAADDAQRPRAEVDEIAVVQLPDYNRFAEWVERRLRQSGVDAPAIPGALRKAVREYLADGYTWFAFDAVELGAETVARETIAYRFAAKTCYYPLRTDRAGEGATDIRLIMVSPRLMTLPDVGGARVRLLHQPLATDPSAMEHLSKELGTLFDPETKLLIRYWSLRSRMGGLKRDLLTTWF